MKKYALYLAGFSFGRGALFLAPILLANLLNKLDYGEIETSLASSSLLASFLAMGSLGILPLVVLRKNMQTTLRGIIGWHLLIVTICIFWIIFCFFKKYSIESGLIALFTGTMALQSLASTKLKVAGNSTFAIVLDAMLLIIMVFSVVIGKLVGFSKYNIYLIFIFVALYLGILIILFCRLMRKSRFKGEKLAITGLLRLGIPLMLGGFISLLATTSGRFGMGMMAGPLDTADYSILARVSVLPIIVHQLILVGGFQKLFTETDSYLEKRILNIAILVALSVLVCIFLYPLIGPIFGHAFIDSFQRNHTAGYWILTQSILWSAIALNDLVLSRNEVMHRTIPYSLIFIIFALGFGWLSLNYYGISIYNFVITHSAVMFGFYLTQVFMMILVGIRLTRVWLFVITTYLLLFFIAPNFFYLNNYF